MHVPSIRTQESFPQQHDIPNVTNAQRLHHCTIHFVTRSISWPTSEPTPALPVDSSSGFPHLPPAAPGPRVKRARVCPPPLWDPDKDTPSTTTPPSYTHPHIPYRGDIRGGTWNAQALLAAKVHRQSAKQRYLFRLCQGRDVVAITETHGDMGACAAILLPPRWQAYWSPGTTAQGRVGILVSETFLAHFDPALTGWRLIEQGRCAALHVAGLSGHLDLIVVYFATGVGHDIGDTESHTSPRRQREAMRALLRTHFNPPDFSWTIIMGDCSWVTKPTDKLCLRTGRFTQADGNE